MSSGVRKEGQNYEEAKSQELLGECFYKLGDFESANQMFSKVYDFCHRAPAKKLQFLSWWLGTPTMLDSYLQVLQHQGDKIRAKRIDEERAKIAKHQSTHSESAARTRLNKYRMGWIEQFCFSSNDDTPDNRISKIDFSDKDRDKE